MNLAWNRIRKSAVLLAFVSYCLGFLVTQGTGLPIAEVCVRTFAIGSGIFAGLALVLLVAVAQSAPNELTDSPEDFSAADDDSVPLDNDMRYFTDYNANAGPSHIETD